MNKETIFLIVVGILFTLGFGFLAIELAFDGKGNHMITQGRGAPGNYLGALITIAIIPIIFIFAWIVTIIQKRSGKYEDD